jgi:hypothetical protein
MQESFVFEISPIYSPTVNGVTLVLVPADVVTVTLWPHTEQTA